MFGMASNTKQFCEHVTDTLELGIFFTQSRSLAMKEYTGTLL